MYWFVINKTQPIKNIKTHNSFKYGNLFNNIIPIRSQKCTLMFWDNILCWIIYLLVYPLFRTYIWKQNIKHLSIPPIFKFKCDFLLYCHIQDTPQHLFLHIPASSIPSAQFSFFSFQNCCTTTKHYSLMLYQFFTSDKNLRGVNLWYHTNGCSHQYQCWKS